jgi:hypothetical protein
LRINFEAEMTNRRFTLPALPAVALALALALALLVLVAGFLPAGAQAARPPSFEAELAGRDVDIERAPGHYIVIQRSTGHYLDPGSSTDATGTAHLTFLRPGVLFRVMVQGLEGANEVTLNLVGERGGEVFNEEIATLWKGGSDPGSFSGRLAGGWLMDADLRGPLAERGLEGLLRATEAGNVYVVIHTAQWPKGEIGGPLISVTFE